MNFGATEQQVFDWFNYMMTNPRKYKKILNNFATFTEFNEYKHNPVKSEPKFEDLYISKIRGPTDELESEEELDGGKETEKKQGKYDDFVKSLGKKKWGELWELTKMIHSKTDGSISLPRIPPKPRKTALVKVIAEMLEML